MSFENVGNRLVKGHDSFFRELAKPIRNRKLPLVKMDTSLSRVGPTRWLKYPLQILENMVMQSAILLQVMFLMGKILKILYHLLIIVMSHVNHTNLQLINKYGDGFVKLLANNGNIKDDIRIPFDEQLFIQIKDDLGEGKYIFLTIMYANTIIKFPTKKT